MKYAKTIAIILLSTILMGAAACAGGNRTVRNDKAAASRDTRSTRTVKKNRGAGADPSKTAGNQAARVSAATARCQELLPLMEKVSKETGLELPLLVGIVRVESNFRNDVRSRAGAIGLTQCMPKTAKGKKCGPLSDEYENLKCGARVFLAFLNYYDGSVYLGLSGYNAGHGMPGTARMNSELPANIEYVEKVLQAASRFESRGCEF